MAAASHSSIVLVSPINPSFSMTAYDKAPLDALDFPANAVLTSAVVQECHSNSRNSRHRDNAASIGAVPGDGGLTDDLRRQATVPTSHRTANSSREQTNRTARSSGRARSTDGTENTPVLFSSPSTKTAHPVRRVPTLIARRLPFPLGMTAVPFTAN